MLPAKTPGASPTTSSASRRTAGSSQSLLLPPGSQRLGYHKYFSESAALLRFGLLKRLDNETASPAPLLRREFGPAPEVVAWLLVEYRPADELQGSLRLHAASSLADFSGLDEDITVDLPVIAAQAPLLAFFGADPQRQLMAALKIAAGLERPLLEADLKAWKEANVLGRMALRLALRDAVLTGAIPYFSAWDCLIDEEGKVSPAILDELGWFNGPLVVSSASPWRMSSADGWDGRPVLWQGFDMPSTGQRAELWRRALDNPETIPPSELEALAGQFALTSAQIQDAAHSARNLALQNGRALQTLDLFEAARLHSAHTLENLAVKIQPRYRWEDIVLPEDELSMLR